MAEALGEVLLKKTIKIYPDELIIGNFSSKRVGGSIFPELHGIPVLMDIFKFSKRETNPLQISNGEIRKLLGIVPFWAFRFLAFKAHKSLFKRIALILHQLKGYYYIINESAGISHIAPDYEKLIAIGTDGIIKEAMEFQSKIETGSEQWFFLEGVKTIGEKLAVFGERYAELASQMALEETTEPRKSELEKIALVCRNVPRKGASSFQAAIQSLFFAQIALNLESLDNSVCPGRMDQYLYPFYEKDLESGAITRESAKELISAFSIKMSEIVPVFSEYMTGIHGGMFNGQVVTVGGVGRDGEDATNELSFIFLEVMKELRMRQPNYHARIWWGSPAKYLDAIHANLSEGSGSPALYNDDVIIETLHRHGYETEDARDYTAVGCVEPVSQGKSFASTDAALLNVPITLELALNGGRKFDSAIRSGAETPSVSKMETMADVVAAFEKQLEFQIDKLIGNLQAIERANRDYHPTPLTSMLIEGCLKSGKCSTGGGALYNFSGVQCVAPIDTGDALYAIEKAVFIDGRISLEDLVKQLKRNIDDSSLLVYLKELDKFGNDRDKVDRWSVYVVDEFIKNLNRFENTRGGKYVAGLYSVTTHEFFGRITGTLPHGRRKGESFSSGIAPVNGMDRRGPTALLNSVNRFDFTKIANGINFNLKFNQDTIQGEKGKAILDTLLKTYFQKGGMQVQVNILDPTILLEARANPGQYPHLLVRVSGYSAYFNDMSPAMQDEIIRRHNVAIS